MTAGMIILQSIASGAMVAGLVCSLTLDESQTRREAAIVALLGALLMVVVFLLGGPVE